MESTSGVTESTDVDPDGWGSRVASALRVLVYVLGAAALVYRVPSGTYLDALPPLVFLAVGGGALPTRSRLATWGEKYRRDTVAWQFFRTAHWGGLIVGVLLTVLGLVQAVWDRSVSSPLLLGLLFGGSSLSNVRYVKAPADLGGWAPRRLALAAIAVVAGAAYAWLAPAPFADASARVVQAFGSSH